MKDKVSLPPSFLQNVTWEKEANPIWLAFSFILHRNLSKHNFPPKMSEAQLQQTFGSLQKALLSIPQLSKPICLNADELSSLDKEFLFEHFLCLEGFQDTLPGQGFVIDESSRFLATINIQNHLRLQLIDCKGDWENTWNTLSIIETAIGSTLEYAFNAKFGYLTSDPGLCGTGLTALSYLHLPALIHAGQLEETLEKQKDEDIIAISMEGRLDDIVGDLVVLKNSCTLGLNEQNILHSIHSTSMKLMALEKTLRTHLQQQNNPQIKDQISRAFGLLMHSYQLQTKEALSALSLVKLGLDLGWIGGVSDEKLNEAFFRCRRAHLTHHLNEKSLDPQETPRKRAEFLHKTLQGIELKV